MMGAGVGWMPMLAGLVSSAALALGCSESSGTPASGGSAGTGGMGATGGGAGAGAGGSAAGAGCMEIRVVSDMVPTGAVKFVPGSVGQMERETLWRDGDGLHFAWNGWITDGTGGEATGLRLVISSFDPSTGQALGHRVFPNFGGVVARAPSGMLCAAGALVEGTTLTTGALMVDLTGSKPEKFVPLYSGSVPIPHVAWDGEAFALHLWGSSGLEVSRISEAGELLLPPSYFGVSAGVLPDLNLSTDAVSGVSFAVSGRFEKVPWVSAHTRDGSPVTGTEALGGTILPVQGDLGGAVSVAFNAVRGVPGGALVAWSLAGGGSEAMVVVQRIDSALAASGDVVLVKPTQYQGANEEKDWLTIQDRPEGWWVGASGPLFLESVRFAQATSVNVENLSSFELIENGQKILDFRHLGSASYNDELWLGFVDYTESNSGELYQPYRIVRILPGCVYPSMWDLLHKK
ncbi:MAG: hypothetical protein IPI67_41880 [Myxococcales bacterium]|nr:hypothetical protein [Myxococcales bacterium]